MTCCFLNLPCLELGFSVSMPNSSCSIHHLSSSSKLSTLSSAACNRKNVNQIQDYSHIIYMQNLNLTLYCCADRLKLRASTKVEKVGKSRKSDHSLHSSDFWSHSEKFGSPDICALFRAVFRFKNVLLIIISIFISNMHMHEDVTFTTVNIVRPIVLVRDLLK